MKQYEPLADNVILKAVVKQSVIILADEKTKNENKTIEKIVVHAIGPNVTTLAIGDEVIISSKANPFFLDSLSETEELIMIKAFDVICKINHV